MTVAIQPDLFRSLLRRHAAGVVVITAAGDSPVGFTATSFTSVSLQPPLVSFCLNRTSSSWPTVSVAGHVAVHVLADGQEQLARTFAARGIDRFAGPTRWRTGRYGLPVLDGALAVLVCRVVERIEAGDHAIVLAELVDGEHLADDVAPLLYHMGRYLRVREGNR
ncbi:flavin reductase family protein [Planosporangium mesophilum]|uniref:Flavin-dependent reductase n=1 Tax=Planosporangium mesophilum TaxID=689768 RepID=A0A8J3TL46_9ACTN|nr:flavin reductase family protein [Planosporangium mesophilum]NJC84499.1 flavin reductase family protein [Planosporangium mesophilum]GII23355.1 flavin-dependent reductase [Planosporangium mesophilum]